MAQLAQARQLLRSGRLAEAERAYQQVLESAPNDLEALNFVALAAMRRGELPAAVALLARAHTADPRDATSLFHLGRAHEEARDAAAARAAYELVLQLEPGHHVARLRLGHVLDSSGQPAEGLRHYMNALARAQLAGQWLNPATTPRSLQPLVERAVQLVLATKREIVGEVMARLTERYGPASLTRVMRALRVYLREEVARPPDPRQGPTMLYFPDLPSRTYYDTAAMAWVPGLEAQFEAIRAELLAVLDGPPAGERVFLDETVESVNLRGKDAAPSWTGFYFHRHGARRDENCARCPRTAAAIEAVPLARVPGHGPEVLFSVFTPGTHLLPHRGVTNARLTTHLPLIVPEDCAINVGGELHHWREGKVVSFDDTYEHEAWNRSQRTRVVMIFDIWNPGLHEVECAALADVLAALSSVRPDSDH